MFFQKPQSLKRLFKNLKTQEPQNPDEPQQEPREFEEAFRLVTSLGMSLDHCRKDVPFGYGSALNCSVHQNPVRRASQRERV